MKRQFVVNNRLAVSALILWMVCSCFFTASSHAREKVVKVTEQQNGQTVKLRSGDILELSLPITGGTGFTWQVANAASTVLRNDGQPEVQKSTDSQSRPGATQIQVFRFAASSKGTEALKLQYLRPWEKNVAPAKEFAITILVK